MHTSGMQYRFGSDHAELPIFPVMSQFRVHISAILLNIGLIVLGLTYYWAYSGAFHYTLFWAGILLVSLSVLSLLRDNRLSRNQKVALLFLFGFIIFIVRTLPSISHFHFTDELYHYQTARLIGEFSTIDVNPQFIISQYYPILEILVVSTQLITSLAVFPVGKVIIGIVHSLVLVFLYLFFKEIGGSEEIAVLSVFVYALNPLYIFFHVLFSYESLGILFVICAFFLIAKIFYLTCSTGYQISAILIVLALAITHHLSSYMLLLFLLITSSVGIAHNLLEYIPKLQSLIRYTLVSTLVVAVWTIHIVQVSLTYMVDNFISRFMKIFEFSFLGGEKTNLFASSLNDSLLPAYEFVIDTFLYMPLVLALSLIGAYFALKQGRSHAFLVPLTFFGPALFIASLALIPTSGSELTTRLWGFAFVGLSLFIAMGMQHLRARGDQGRPLLAILQVGLVALVCILVIGGFSIGYKPIHRVPDLLHPQQVSGPGSLTTDLFSAADWFEKNAGRGYRVVGERTSSIVFGSHASQDVDRWNAWRVFLPGTMDASVLEYLRSSRIEYIVVDIRMTEVLAEYGNYFDKKEVYRRDFEVFGYEEVLPLECIEKFDAHSSFAQIYTNGNIVIDTWEESNDGE